MRSHTFILYIFLMQLCCSVSLGEVETLSEIIPFTKTTDAKFENVLEKYGQKENWKKYLEYRNKDGEEVSDWMRTRLLQHLTDLISDRIVEEYKSKNYSGVVSLQSDFVEGFPPIERVWYVVASAHVELKQYTEAKKRLIPALLVEKDDPVFTAKLNCLLARLYRVEGRHDLAKKHYELALKFNEEPESYIFLGINLLEKGDVDGCFDYLNKYIAICEVPDAYTFMRLDELEEIYFDERYLELLVLLKQRSLDYFIRYEDDHIVVCTPLIRDKCLFLYCVFWTRAREAGHKLYAEKVYECMEAMSFSKLDIYLEAIRMSPYEGDELRQEYLEIFKGEGFRP